MKHNMKQLFFLFSLFLFPNHKNQSFGFTLPKQQQYHQQYPSRKQGVFVFQKQLQYRQQQKQHCQRYQHLFRLRGGTDSSICSSTTSLYGLISTSVMGLEYINMLPAAITTYLSSSLQTSGLKGIGSLILIATTVCIPATQIKSFYAISVGYGFSIAAIGYSMLLLLLQGRDATTLLPTTAVQYSAVWAAIFYGLRLGIYLLIRDIVGMQRGVKPKSPSRIQRVPFALSVAIFYAFLTTPLLYFINDTTTSATSMIPLIGTSISWIGAILEAVADTHKFVIKLKHRNTSNDGTFYGPTNLAYRITRHPNYTGEIVFWIGIYLSGLTSMIPFTTITSSSSISSIITFSNVVGFVCSSLGLYGIISIMKQATNSLEEKQADKYNSQESYEKWTKNVPWTLIPFIK